MARKYKVFDLFFEEKGSIVFVLLILVGLFFIFMMGAIPLADPESLNIPFSTYLLQITAIGAIPVAFGIWGILNTKTCCVEITAL